MEVVIGGKHTRINPSQFVAAGGEAEIYRIGDTALKIYHPNMLTTERQRKLDKFPRNLPDNVLSPKDLIKDSNGKTIGFTMPFVKDAENFIELSNPNYRQRNVTQTEATKIMIDVYNTLNKIHKANVVVGDMNNLNLMFKGTNSYFIDTDSMQFEGFPCIVAMEQFIDPALYGVDLTKGCHFTKQTDYYAYAIMLFMSHLYTHPYGGVHKGVKKFLDRAKNKITVFDPAVKYPKAGIHYNVLSDEMLHYFHEIFEQGKRYLLDEKILNNVVWTTCTKCGMQHSRHVCPSCMTAKPSQTIMVNAKCTQTKLFETSGIILYSKIEKGVIKYIYYENGQLFRENGKLVAKYNVGPKTRFDIMGGTSIVGEGDNVISIQNDGNISRYRTTTLNGVPIFSSTNDSLYYIENGKIISPSKDILSHKVEIGDVLEDQTWFKVGNQLGFGFYRVGRKVIYFKFDVGKPNSLKDDIKIPQINGQMVDIDAVFSDTHILFTMSVAENGKIVNHMYLLDSKGNVVSSLVGDETNRSISSIHGKVLGGSKVITSTDDGLLSLDGSSGYLQEGNLFTDTAPFIKSGLKLLTAPEGIYTISNKQIHLLKLN